MPSSQTTYAELVEAVLRELATGVMPWRKPWTAATPTNLFTRRAYQGVNRLILRAAAIERRYASPHWITERQAETRGGRVLPSERERFVMACSMRWKAYRATDRIGMPARENFENDEAYHATLFHELVHATGHPSRCARFEADGTADGFRSPEYAFEELVAELGAVFLCGEAGIANRCLQNNSACLGSWLKVLKNDRRRLFVAARLAEKACDTILGRESPAAIDAWAATEGEDGETAPDARGQARAVQGDLAASSVTT